MTDKLITIPFLELIKRSFNNVLLNSEYFVKIALIPVLGLSLIAMLNLNPLITMLFSGVGAIFISVYWCRKIILNENVNKDNLYLKQIWNYMCKYMIFILIFLAPAIIITAISVALNYVAIKTAENAYILYTIPVLATLVVSFFCVRLRMALAAVAVDDQELGFKLAFKLSQGNTTRLFFAIIIVIMPVSITLQIIASLYGFFEGNIILQFIWNLLFYGLNMLSAAFYASYDAHVYQYFSYFYHKAIEDFEAREAGELIEEKIKARRE